MSRATFAKARLAALCHFRKPMQSRRHAVGRGAVRKIFAQACAECHGSRKARRAQGPAPINDPGLPGPDQRPGLAAHHHYRAAATWACPTSPSKMAAAPISSR